MTKANYLLLLCSIPATQCLQLKDDIKLPPPPPTMAPIYTPVNIINDVIEQMKLTSEVDEKRVQEITAITNKVLEEARFTSTNVEVTNSEGVQNLTDSIVQEVMTKMSPVADKVTDVVNVDFITSKAPTPSPAAMIDSIAKNVLANLNLDGGN